MPGRGNLRKIAIRILLTAFSWSAIVTAAISSTERTTPAAKHENNVPYQIVLDRTTACSFDRVLVGFTALIKPHIRETVQVGLFKISEEQDRLLALVPTFVNQLKPIHRKQFWWQNTETQNDSSGELEELHCDISVECHDNPTMVSLVASSGYQIGSTLSIAFNKDTNTPRVASKDDVDKLVHFSDSIGRNYTGQWTSKRNLVITIHDPTGHGPYHDGGMQASLVSGSRNPTAEHKNDNKKITDDSVVVEGIVPFRIAVPGTYKFRLLRGYQTSSGESQLLFCDVKGNYDILSSSHELNVVSEIEYSTQEQLFTCGTTEHGLQAWMSHRKSDGEKLEIHQQTVITRELVLAAELQHDENSGTCAQKSPENGEIAVVNTLSNSTPLEPVWQISNVIVLDRFGGGAVVSPLVLGMGNNLDGSLDTWSLSMWLYLPHHPRKFQEHRSLFYHGKGAGHESESRTPSAWLLPKSNRIALRVSTKNQLDYGADSTHSIPQSEWTHVVFTFGFVGPKYVAQCYINGVLSITFRVNQGDSTSFNIGNLHIGKDPWIDGTQGYATKVQLYDQTLTLHQLRHIRNENELSDCAGKLSVGLSKLGCGNSPRQKDAQRHSETPFVVNVENEKVSLVGESPLVSSWGDLSDGGARLAWETGRDHMMSHFQQCSETGKFKSLDALRDTIRLLKLAASSTIPEANMLLASLSLIGRLSFHDKGNSFQETQCVQVIKHELEDVDAYFHLRRAAQQENHKAVALFWMAILKGGPIGSTTDASSITIPYDFDDSGIKTISELTTSNEQSDETSAFELLLSAASQGSVESKLALGTRFGLYSAEKESMEVNDCETAAFYLRQVAGVAHAQFHSGGHEPILEQQLLSEFVPHSGEKGVDDEVIQFQQLQADQGNIDAMVAMGDLYYWGAHGLPRDQAQAFHYFERAAMAGHPVGMAAAGNLLLKGEGVAKNTTRALEFYQQAAELDNLGALNGLGFLYYTGSAQGIEKNETKALEYFLMNGRDGDSLFNAGFLLQNGKGTKRDVQRARRLFHTASDKFGHFDATFALAMMYYDGVVEEEITNSSQSRNSSEIEKRYLIQVERSCPTALKYLKVASRRSRWGESLRRGFDSFLANDLDTAYLYYQQAALLGYETGARNSLWILHEKQRSQTISNELGFKPEPHHHDIHDPSTRELQQLIKRQSEVLLEMNPDSPMGHLYLGEFYYYGKENDEQNIQMALFHWMKASGNGEWNLDALARSQASYNTGFVLEHFAPEDQLEASWALAKLYYERATSQLLMDASKELVDEQPAVGLSRVVVQVSLARLRIRQWLHKRFGMKFEPFFQLIGTGALKTSQLKGLGQDSFNSSSQWILVFFTERGEQLHVDWEMVLVAVLLTSLCFVTLIRVLRRRNHQQRDSRLRVQAS